MIAQSDDFVTHLHRRELMMHEGEGGGGGLMRAAPAIHSIGNPMPNVQYVPRVHVSSYRSPYNHYWPLFTTAAICTQLRVEVRGSSVFVRPYLLVSPCAFDKLSVAKVGTSPSKSVCCNGCISAEVFKSITELAPDQLRGAVKIRRLWANTLFKYTRVRK